MLPPPLKKTKKKTLKLYVWEQFSKDYSGGLAVAISTSEESAKKKVVKFLGYTPSDWGDLSVLPLTKTTAFAVSGGS